MKRRYTGTAGRIENGQVGVFLGYAGRHGRALIDRALYLPEDWAEDRARRRGARVPEDVAFATKPALALAMLERARAAGVPCAWVAADSVHGAAYAVRRWIEDQALGYVLAVTGARRFGFGRVAQRAERIPADEWHRLSAGEGAKGPRLYDWAHVVGGGDAAPGSRRGLLVRRSLADPGQLTFYLTHAPEGVTLAELVRVAGGRWAIESLFEQAKGEVGLDQYEVRSWGGWHRHVTLSMFALAHLAAVRKGAVGGADPADLAADLLPLTVPEVRRLLAALAGLRPPRPEAVLHWSRWRRRHQQSARRAHWHRRTRGHSGETRL